MTASSSAATQRDPRHHLSASTLASAVPHAHDSPRNASHGSFGSLGRSRPARAAAGGFLLDSGGPRTSLERKSFDRDRDHDRDRDLYSKSSFNSGGSTAVAAGRDSGDSGPAVSIDTDPARMVSLVLGETEKRKKVAQASKRSTLAVPAAEGAALLSSPEQGNSKRSRDFSPSRAFKSLGRSSSQGRRFMQALQGAPSSPPPAPGRAHFPTPVLVPPPAQQEGGGSLKKRGGNERSSLGAQQLKELQSQYKFTDATLQRTLKAKQTLQLSALYKRLLEIQTPPQSAMGGFAAALVGDAGKAKEYNPLQVIRNRKTRNRKKIQLDVGPWEDPGAVEQWVEDVAVAQYSPGPDGGGIPHPPTAPGGPKKLKRPRMDWVVAPEEMLADHYYEEVERRKLQAMGREREHAERKARHHAAEQARKSIDGRPEDIHAGDSPEEEPRQSWDSPRQIRRDGSRAPNYKELPNSGYESTATTSSSSSSSSSSSDPEDDYTNSASVNPKHHRRRRKLKAVLTGKPSAKKKKLSRQEQLAQLALEESRRRLAADNESPRASLEFSRKLGFTTDDDASYDSPAPLRKTGTESTAYSLPNASKSSLERYTSLSGFGIIGGRGGVAEDFIPSIAINLSPPRRATKEEEDRDEKKRRRKFDDILEGREDGAVSSLTPLFKKDKDKEKEKDKDKTADEDAGTDGRDSLDLERSGTKKEKKDVLGRVKTRVERIRSSAKSPLKDCPPDVRSTSPIGSSFSQESLHSDADVFHHAHAVTDDEGIGGAGLHRPPRGRSSLEVPGVTPLQRWKSATHAYSTGQLPTMGGPSAVVAKEPTGRQSFESIDSRRSMSPDKHHHHHHHAHLHAPRWAVSRDPSPVRNVVIESVRTPREPIEHAEPIPTTVAPLPPLSHIATPFAVPPRSDLRAAETYLLRTGILARALAARAPTAATACARSVASRAAAVDAAATAFGARAETFTTRTVPRIEDRVEATRRAVEVELTPLVRALADDADVLSERVTTEMTLRVKGVGDEVGGVLRQRKRGGRVMGRVGWALLEWVLLGVMWVVWAVVVVLRIIRAVGRGGVRVGRWILWL